ncbi:DUF4124 domain-containing protein [Alloalcanivorax sp. C16-2]|uniref:DUF4124 domain-containing protein n=1 Tax=Alloalcanivorax TaxID=3020832 RepID=UPI0019347181|nr:DUF4124 domain-containing protein [Alloalcanivorax marinus]MBL7252495.1 DUF4124 domain-containing protein [Alloalcanivorax marinus]
MKTWPLLLILLPLAALAQTDTDAAPSAGIYRVVDENGNVVFTDNPPENSGAEPVSVGPTNTMDSPRPREDAIPRAPDDDRASDPRRGPDATDFNGYRSLTIVSPANQATVRLPQDNPVTIEVRVEPRPPEGHRVELIDNGTPVQGLSLDFPDPGTHSLRAVIKDSQGRILITSDPITLYVHRVSAADGAGAGGGLPSVGGAAQRGGAAAAGGSAKGGSAAQRGAAGALGAPATRATR